MNSISNESGQGAGERDSHGKSAESVHQQVTVITPRRGLFDLDLAGVWNSRELLYFLTLRDIRARYKQTALGALWAVLQPALSALIFTVIFGVFARFPSDGIPYPLFAFASILPWTFFAEATRRATMSLVRDEGLVKKVYFPRLIILLVAVITPVFDFLVSFVVLVLLMLFFSVPVGPQVLLLPPLMLLPMLLSLALGLWLGPVNVKYRDITQVVPFLLQIGMYASPIVYPLSMVPEQWRDLYSLNPVVGVIEAFRWALFGTGQLDHGAILTSLATTVVLLAAGLIFFRKAERSFADII